MKTWTGTYWLDGINTTITVEADQPNDATEAFFSQMPPGAVFVSLAPEPDHVVVAAVAKLVDLGLTPEEAAVMVPQ